MRELHTSRTVGTAGEQSPVVTRPCTGYGYADRTLAAAGRCSTLTPLHSA